MNHPVEQYECDECGACFSDSDEAEDCCGDTITYWFACGECGHQYESHYLASICC
jgi:predicted nucleic acid-binding Zn ribbon protein